MLSNVPDFLQLQTFQKMKPVSFARTYRTAKFIMEAIEENADSFRISMPKTLKLTIYENWSHLINPQLARIEIGRKEYIMRSTDLHSEFECTVTQERFYFFNFQEFFLSDYRVGQQDQNANDLSTFNPHTLRTVQFEKFTTLKSTDVSTFRDALETKMTKLKCSGRNVPQHDDNFKFNEVDCDNPSIHASEYLLDKVANHVPSVTMSNCNFEIYYDEFPRMFTSFVNLVKNAIHSDRSGVSFNIYGSAHCEDSVEDLFKRFPTPEKRLVLGLATLFVYSKKDDNDSYLSLRLLPKSQHTERGKVYFEFNFVHKPMKSC